MFGNTRTEGDRPGPATGSRQGPFSLIGGDVVVTGDIKATVDLHVDGRVDGDLACAALVQGSDSVIRGNVTACTARIAGTVEGSITADELTIETGATVIGDCTYGVLTVASGASINGRFSPRAATGPDLKVVGE
jgi:cytoskeletal protein CcmA (bactofilin family)